MAEDLILSCVDDLLTTQRAESNYAIKINLVKGSDSNVAGIGYLDNQCLNWPNDIRWANNLGNELSYYCEESDTTEDPAGTAITWGTPSADATNIYVTVTSGKDFIWEAILNT